MKKRYRTPFLLLLLLIGLVTVSPLTTHAATSRGVESVEGKMEADIEFYEVKTSSDDPPAKGEGKTNFLPKTGEAKGVLSVLIGSLMLFFLVVIIKRKVVDFDE